MKKIKGNVKGMIKTRTAKISNVSRHTVNAKTRHIANKKTAKLNSKTKEHKNKTQEKQTRELNIDKLTVPKRKDPHLDSLEKAVLWHLYLGAQSVDKIATGLALTVGETKQILEGLENKLIAERHSLMGQYRLTENGLKKIEPRKVSLDTKLNKWAIRHGQETDLWVMAKNSGGAPLNNVLLRISVPKFVDVSRFSANKYSEEEKNITEFMLAQMHPGEAQHVNFKVKGHLTNGALSSKYKIDVQALVDDKETDKKELNISVAK